jgi:hypothetical protein
MGLLRVRKEVISAHFLPYSTLKGEYSRGKIDYNTGTIHHMNRDEIKFITLETYNYYMKSNYENINSLIFNPQHFEKEVELRGKLGINGYDLSTIVVVEKIPINKIEILLQAKTYSDVKEVLVEL